jgi:hypothetical protein
MRAAPSRGKAIRAELIDPTIASHNGLTGAQLKPRLVPPPFITGQDYHKQARVTGRHTGLCPVAASRLMTSARALRTLWRDEQPNPRAGNGTSL